MSIPNELVKQLLGPGWNVTHFVNSVDAVVCPHCKTRFPKVELTSLNLSICQCSACGRSYSLQIVDSPLGKAYMTEAIS